ncbi:MAG: single-stranded-DNA-specific exonuclease RecJ [Clostridia bacterium]|nr:single-stranded-DNA-specific exonuclease RecJ [Clostridia bacterium]
MLFLTLSSPLDTVYPLPGLPAWLCDLLAARGVADPEEAQRFLHPSFNQLRDPNALQGVAKAAGLIRGAAAQGKKAAIYGDYDVDGVSASAILWETLGMLGMERKVYLPDRHSEGYGLNVPAVEKLAEEAELLITVDCGITSVKEVRRAKELGMTVIVTDHHQPPDELPDADAVVSPLLGGYPFPGLCGASVAWKLALALVGDQAMELMELAAVATVADMVPLADENRAIVSLGLERLALTKRPGLRAVMNRAGVQGRVTSDQVAFQIAPRMNACGRMASARIAFDMLTTRSLSEAEELALKMEALNRERKTQENLVLEAALSQAAGMDLVENHAIVVWGEGWNSGVVGLAAGKVAEQYACPTVALAVDVDTCVGSARSAGDVDIYKALSQCADLFERFGGHRQAAGLTLKKENLETFSHRLSDAVAEQTGGRPIIPEIRCDAALSLRDVTEETVQWLQKLEPFGMGNPTPRFLCEDAQALSLRRVGAEGKHLKCSFAQNGILRDGIYFGGGDWAGKTDARFRFAFSPTLNEFHGRISAECRVYALQMMPESLAEDRNREAVSLFSENGSGVSSVLLSPGDLPSLMASGQGTLLACRCLKTAKALLKQFPEADFCLDEAKDGRAFNTILLYGSAANISPAFRNVVLCDGDMGEGDAYRAACPKADVAALPFSDILKQLLKDSFVNLDSLRNCYVTLRKQSFPDLYALSAACGMTYPQSAFALSVLREIGLADVSFSPFHVSLLPMVRRNPEESFLYQKAKSFSE